MGILVFELVYFPLVQSSSQKAFVRCVVKKGWQNILWTKEKLKYYVISDNLIATLLLRFFLQGHFPRRKQIGSK
jgi:hypothetical protein